MSNRAEQSELWNLLLGVPTEIQIQLHTILKQLSHIKRLLSKTNMVLHYTVFINTYT